MPKKIAPSFLFAFLVPGLCSAADRILTGSTGIVASKPSSTSTVVADNPTAKSVGAGTFSLFNPVLDLKLPAAADAESK